MICGGCNNKVHGKRKICPTCLKPPIKPVVIKVPRKWKLVKEWQTIPIGTIIRIEGGHYWLSDEEKVGRRNLGDSGMFELVEIGTDYLMALNITTAKSSAKHYIYMGEERPGKYGLILSPHKIYVKNTKSSRVKKTPHADVPVSSV